MRSTMMISLGAPRSSQLSPAVAIVRKPRKIAIFVTTRRTGQCCAVAGTGRAPSVHTCHYCTPCPFCNTATHRLLSKFRKFVKHVVKHNLRSRFNHIPNRLFHRKTTWAATSLPFLLEKREVTRSKSCDNLFKSCGKTTKSCNPPTKMDDEGDFVDGLN